jgi:hypothetical protein
MVLMLAALIGGPVGPGPVLASEEKPRFVKPSLGGAVVAVSSDPVVLTVEIPAGKKGAKPVRQRVRVTARTQLEYSGVPEAEQKPTVGFLASVWLDEGSETAVRIRFEQKQVILTGRVVAVSADGKTITVETASGKVGRTEVRLAEGAKLVYHEVEPRKPAAGQFVQVWLRGSSREATGAVFSSRETETPEKSPPPPSAPAGGEKKPPSGGKKPAGEAFDPPPPPRPARDPGPLARAIDAEIDRRLAERKVTVSPPAEDAEFLRRVHLDLTGRIPTYRRAVLFLDSTNPDKRSQLIDELLASPRFGQHQATVWHNLLAPPDPGVNAKGKGGRDTFSPWLAEQFNRERGWDAIVRDLLTVEGPLNANPQIAFLMANAEDFHPQPERVAGSVARLFWGVQLRCAECHSHPFQEWKQSDFWETAAFFSRLRFTGFKGPGVPSFVEEKGRGEGIVVPASAGKLGGRIIRPRFLLGEPARVPIDGSLRQVFAAWATSADHPFFARATANRTWAHFFGRGLVPNLDDLESGEPSHPVLLDRLAKDLTASAFDLKHLARAICNSKAYQRTSKPAAGNENDRDGFSRMALKPLSPESLYDSLETVMAVDKSNPWMKGRSRVDDVWPTRVEFARAFRPEGESGAAGVLGIPQALHLLNGPLLNRGAPIVEELCARGMGPTEAISALYLTALSRRPTAEEIRLLSAYLERRKHERSGYRGVLWMLLNSGEFSLNH